MRLTATVIAMTMILPLPAKGHTRTAQTEWKQTWVENTLADRHLSRSELSTYLSFTSKHRAPVRLPVQARPRTTWTGSVEQWRWLVESHFTRNPSVDVPWAMRVMHCESRGDPNAYNPTSGASGLFQHLQRYWADRSAKAGIPGADVFDPTANVRVAAWLYYTGGPQHWECR